MRILAIVISVLLLIGFDIITKWFFTGEYQWLFPECYDPSCIYNYYSIVWEWIGIQVSYNTGVAFSLPIRGIVLQILTVLLIAGIVYQYIHEEYSKKSKLLDAWYALILAWALSHAYERVFVGHVVDFIAVKYFAILNFADIFISIGAACIVCYYIFYGKLNSR